MTISSSLPSWTALASLPILLLPLGYFILLRPSSTPSTTPPGVQLGHSGKSRPSNALPSVLAPAYTTHARLLPTPSKHAFSYPLLYIGVDVDALEAGALDLGYRIFKYGGVAGRLLGLRSQAYLTPDVSSSSDIQAGAVHADEQGQQVGERGRLRSAAGLRQKVEDLLRDYDVKAEQVGRIWMLTMPSFLGFEGINPLTVWFVYRSNVDEEERIRELSAVILEVHNTFGEKHAYVLPTSSSFTVPPKDGYSHAWTFPRGFHVSPFNSRDGYYTLDLLDPFLQSSPASPSSSLSSSSSFSDPYPNFKVFLRLLTPSRQTKLHALLASSPSPTSPPIPLQSGNTARLLGTLAKWPLALIATTPRILYQAYRLHYERKLAVYPRPEPGESIGHPRAGSDTDEGGDSVREGGGEKGQANEPNADWAQSGRAIGWQGAGGLEKMARGVLERYLQARLAHADASPSLRGLQVDFTYPSPSLHIDPLFSNSDKTSTQAIAVRTADPKFFTHLLLLPSPVIALTLFPELGTCIAATDEADFIALFSSLSASRLTSLSLPMLSRIVALRTANTRRSYLTHLFAHSLISPEPKHTSALSSDCLTDPSAPEQPLSPLTPSIHTKFRQLAHPFSISDQLRVLLIVTLAAWADWAEEWIMNAVGARFIQGQEPWKVWERAMKRAYSMPGKRDERDGVIQRQGSEDWNLARTDSDSSMKCRDSVGSRGEGIKGDEEGEWVDLGSVRYA